jgi:quercetin dioxygenase-like cupin family protein
MRRSHLVRATALALAGILASVGVVVATPGAGAVGTTFARGTLEAGLKIHTPALKISTRQDVDVVAQTITIAPGGHTGWHTHPGPVFVVIQAGTLTYYDADDPACSPSDYAAGDSFVDEGGHHSHIARNEGSTDVVLYATYLLPVGAPLRTDADDPGTCPF